MAKSERPRIYEYLDYKRLLKDFIAYWRNQGLYSTRKFAESIGVSNPNQMKLIVDGKRGLSTPLAKRIAKEFRFRRQEQEYLLKLIEFERAQDVSEQADVFQSLMAFGGVRKANEKLQFEHEYFSNWHVVVIMESLRHLFKASQAEEIAVAMELPLGEVQKSLRLLESHNLIRFENSKWEVAEFSFQTPAEFHHLNIRNFHRQMIQKAMEALDRFAVQDRSVGSLTIPLSRKSYQEVQHKVRDFFRGLNAMYSVDEKADSVYQINYQVFPIVLKKED